MKAANGKRAIGITVLLLLVSTCVLMGVAQAQQQSNNNPPPQLQQPGDYSMPQQPPPGNNPQQQQPNNYPPPQQQAPAYLPPQQLDGLVSRIALYPDPLLAQVMATATYPDQIQPAAQWADQHHYLSGPDLANAITNDHLWFDPSVQSLLPFPNVLDKMAADMRWTTDLGNAFLSQRQEVMDAVQRMRATAYRYHYLQSNGQVVVVARGPYIEINPFRPDVLYVPYYDPFVVYYPPRPGFFIGAGIGWGFHITIGEYYRPWGWGYAGHGWITGFSWGSHVVIVNNAHWDRNWQNRSAYVHPYSVQRYEQRQAAENHELYNRTTREKQAAQVGYHPQEEHRVAPARQAAKPAPKSNEHDKQKEERHIH